MLTNIRQPSQTAGTYDDKPDTISTTEFGIQVDLNCNPESLTNTSGRNQQEEKGGLSQAERRKLTKKLSKKRKREKTQLLQRQARLQIGIIIEKLYDGSARFEDFADKIEELVELVYTNDFRDYLDQLIRKRVTDIQKGIWQYTQQILDDNPFESKQDHPFYGLMVDYLYQRYIELRHSSMQIEKIINIYLRLTYQNDQNHQEIVYNNLANNTFNYLVDTDHTLKNLIHICQQKLSSQKKTQCRKLAELIQLIEHYQTSDQQEQSSNCYTDDRFSTGLSEEEENIQKKRKRKKIKESELITTEQALTRRLENLNLNERERAACRLSQDAVKRLKMKAAKYKI